MGRLLAKSLNPYLTYNKSRITRLLELMPPKTKPLFHILTFLLHTNLRVLPGYIKDKEAHYGIENWRWDQDKLDDLNDFKEWGFKKVLSLGDRFHNFYDPDLSKPGRQA